MRIPSPTQPLGNQWFLFLGKYSLITPDSYPFWVTHPLPVTYTSCFISSSFRFLFRVPLTTLLSQWCPFWSEKCFISRELLNPSLNDGNFYFPCGILSTFGNGYVLYMSSRRKRSWACEIMTVNLAVCDLGISGNTAMPFLLWGFQCPVIKSSLAHRSHPQLLLLLFSQVIFAESVVSQQSGVWP